MILVIYAHPKAEGFNSRVLKEVKKTFELKGEEYEILDLYEMNYNPVLKKEELYTAGNRSVSDQNIEIQRKIQMASGLVFIYPIWWGGMPAILKGFMDRVFTPGFAFQYKRRGFMDFVPDRYLKDKKVISFVTSAGPRFLYLLLLHPIKAINKFMIFGFVGSRSKTYQVYSATNLNEQKEREIKRLVSRGMRWLLKRKNKNNFKKT